MKVTALLKLLIPSEACVRQSVRFWRSWDRASLMYSFKYTNKMQPYTIFFITVNALHVSRGFSAHHQELKSVHTVSGIRQAYLLLPLEWVSWNNLPTLAVTASKLDVYHILCVQF